ncbi:MAG: exodeoxyribonuclease VII small subunit [Deltaproteobacteria bacterium]|nr:exodeoxyribonuclease VII small subunit [Deltaproteobacteria bacterium]
MDTTEEIHNTDSFNGMLRKVESIISGLSGDGTDLDDLVQKVEQGYDLIRRMQQKLEQTRMTIEKLQPGPEVPTTEEAEN